jgi:hypothetical protein
VMSCVETDRTVWMSAWLVLVLESNSVVGSRAGKSCFSLIIRMRCAKALGGNGGRQYVARASDGVAQTGELGRVSHIRLDAVLALT